jgi:hypothetical protein
MPLLRAACSRKTPIAPALLTLSFGALLAACASDEAVAPVGTSTATAPEPSSHPSSNPPEQKRTVVERSPYGDVASDNLLWDGDFEWSSPFTDQYGWIDIKNGGPPGDIAIGPACKSGIKCLRIAKSGGVVGLALSSETAPLESSLWVRFETKAGEEPPACSKLSASLFDLGIGIAPEDPVDALTADEAPDADGWCHLTGVAPVRKNKAYLLVQNQASVPAIIDDCVVRAQRSTVTTPPPASPAPPTPEQIAALGQARTAVLAARLPQDGKPNPARDAFAARHAGAAAAPPFAATPSAGEDGR